MLSVHCWRPAAVYKSKNVKNARQDLRVRGLTLWLLSCTSRGRRTVCWAGPKPLTASDCLPCCWWRRTAPEPSPLSSCQRTSWECWKTETQNQQWAGRFHSGLNTRGKVEERQRTGRERRSGRRGTGVCAAAERGWKRLKEAGDEAAASHFFTGILPSWFTCSFSFVYLQPQTKVWIIINLSHIIFHTHTNTHCLRFEE